MIKPTFFHASLKVGNRDLRRNISFIMAIFPQLAPAIVVGCLILLASTELAAQVREDEIVLRSGQRLYGSVEENRVGPRNDLELRIELSDGSILILQREMFLSWKPEPTGMPEYRDRVIQVKETSAEQWELADWCKKNNLKVQAEVHARKTIALEPEHTEARRLLGHALIRNQWVDFDQKWKSWGYEKVGTRWVLPEALELAKYLKEQQELSTKWKMDITAWFRIANGSGRNAPEALANIRSIRDPVAVPILAEMLMNKRTVLAERRELIAVLAEIPTLSASYALLEYYLEDQDPNDVEGRERCLQALAKRDQHKPQIARRLVDQLNPDMLGDRSKISDHSIPTRNTERLTRAATALRVIDVRIGIEQLIVAMRVNYNLKTTVRQNAQSGPTGVTGGGGSQEINQQVTLDCPAALETLRKFTGKSFPSDQQQWIQWWIAENTPKNLDLRRDY